MLTKGIKNENLEFMGKYRDEEVIKKYKISNVEPNLWHKMFNWHLAMKMLKANST